MTDSGGSLCGIQESMGEDEQSAVQNSSEDTRNQGMPRVFLSSRNWTYNGPIRIQFV